VRVAAPASFRESVEAAGFEHAPFDDVDAGLMGQAFARLPSLTRAEADRVVVADVFGRLDAQAALPGVQATLASWRPDLVLREPCELGSLAAACAQRVPHATVAIGVRAATDAVEAMVVDPLRELDDAAGLSPGTCAAAFASAPTFTSVPPLLDGSNDEGDHRFRDGAVAAAGQLPRAWGNPDDPLVYVSFGSVAASQARFVPLYRSVLEVLADQPVRVLLTTGPALSRSDLGPVPANACVEHWWPQAAVLAHATAVVGHGGFGTTMGAVAAGIPQVVVPLFSFDQFLNAERIAAVGAGTTVDASAGSLTDLPAALREVLHRPTYRETAMALAAEVDALPEAASMVPRLETLAAPR
jgi:hypothetical protein